MNSDIFAKSLNDHLDKRCETAQLDFKSEFDVNSAQHWCELVKDIVAFANSGGGIIAIGVNDNGSKSSSDVGSILALDPADISNKIQKYTNCNYADFRLIELNFDSAKIACFVIGGVQTPIAFERPGTYQVAGTNQQKSAFSQGTFYFRHGAKSEPGTTDDLRAVIDREIERRRIAWLENIRKVVEAPADSKVLVVSNMASESSNEPLRKFRLSGDQDAPLMRELDPNKTHPHRQKEVALMLSQRLEKNVSGHDIFAIRRAHAIDARPEYCYRPTYSSPLFSPEFIDWIVSRCHEIPEFIESARQHLRKQGGDQANATSADERLQRLKEHMRKHGHSQAAMARKLNVSTSTISRLLRGKYDGDVDNILKRIEDF